MLRTLLILGALLLPVAVCSAQQRAVPEEYPTAWEVPPGDPVEHRPDHLRRMKPLGIQRLVDE